MFRLLIACTFIVFYMISCTSNENVPDTPNPPIDLPTKSSYKLNVKGESFSGAPIDFTLVGDSFSANWDADFNTIYLGTDEINEPLGTFTAELRVVDNRLILLNSTLSKTDVRVGTSAELNAQLYSYIGQSGWIDISYLDDEIIVFDSLMIPMDRVITNQSQEEETVVVTGKFTVVD